GSLRTPIMKSILLTLIALVAFLHQASAQLDVCQPSVSFAGHLRSGYVSRYDLKYLTGLEIKTVGECLLEYKVQSYTLELSGKKIQTVFENKGGVIDPAT